MEILKLKPYCNDYLWGGTRLRKEYGKVSKKDIISESWDLSCHKDGPSVIACGKYTGKTLNEYIQLNGKSVLGTKCAKFDDFPILIKLIDAADNLSVQVHPDNEYALRVEGEYGKTEMWYIIDCDADSELIYGFKSKIDKDTLRRAIENDKLLDIVNRIKVKKGDVFFVDTGTIHAIGKGILVAEVQQNSNTTYRVHDFNRLGADGKPRELHIEKAIDVTNCDCVYEQKNADEQTINHPAYSERLLASCEYFTTKLICVHSHTQFICDETSFHSVLCLSGECNVKCESQSMQLLKGDSIFIPADFGSYEIEGKCELLVTTL